MYTRPHAPRSTTSCTFGGPEPKQGVHDETRAAQARPKGQRKAAVATDFAMKKAALAENRAEEEAIKARAKGAAPAPAPAKKSLAEAFAQCFSKCVELPTTKAYYRVTHIPIKKGAMPEIVKIANTPEFLENTKTFFGFLGVDVLSVGDDTMVTCSRWKDKAACDGGAAALGGVLKGFLSKHVAGPPKPPAVGMPVLRMIFKPEIKKTAYRTVTFTFKDDAAMKAALTHIRTMEVERSVFRAIDGLADLTLIPGPAADGKPTVFALAGYDKMASLEAAGPKIKEVMMELGPHYASPPSPAAASVQWQLPLPK